MSQVINIINSRFLKIRQPYWCLCFIYCICGMNNLINGRHIKPHKDKHKQIKNDYDMIYLSTAIGLTPGGSSTVHIYTQTTHRTTQITTNLEECGPCPVFVSFTLAFALQMRKRHGKTSVRVVKECTYTYCENTHTLQNLHPHIHTHTHTHAHTLQNPHIHTQARAPTHYKTHTYTHTHTLQNNIKPPQYKLKHSKRYTQMK
jgi:hypothetical protein